MASLLSFGRNFAGRTVIGSAPVINQAELGGVRNGAKLKEVKGRIRSVKNIGKITKTMKMIASARLREAQTRSDRARPFFENALKPFEEMTARKAGEQSANKSTALVAIFSDKGLCGGLNGNIGRAITPLVKERAKQGQELSIVGVGDKSLSGTLQDASRVVFSFGDTSRHSMSFSSVSDWTERILTHPSNKFDSVAVMYNKFISVINFKPTVVDVPGFEQMVNDAYFDQFEFEDDARDEHLRDVYQYSVASTIYGAYVENLASELGSRMTAMDNATRNATDMLKRLEVAYNRGRQAAITTELTEIISGAAAVE